MFLCLMIVVGYVLCLSSLCKRFDEMADKAIEVPETTEELVKLVDYVTEVGLE